MEVFAGLLMIAAVSALIAAPLVRADSAAAGRDDADSQELWEREKTIALLAIKEAEFDYATGKLSDDDYDSLKTGYEKRALDAMGKLERPPAPGPDKPTSARASFCPRCGQQFAGADKFCSGCGAARPAVA
jgi:hypothetical protein